MHLKIVRIVSTATLAVGLFAGSSENYKVLMQFLVSACATLAVFHATRSRAEYFWGVTFCVIAVLFNPVFPFVLPGHLFVPLDLICMALFFGYCSSYKSKPALAMPSVIDGTPEQHLYQRSGSRPLMLAVRGGSVDLASSALDRGKRHQWRRKSL